ncbi:ABC transporter ATP-binding protein [Leisingera sp. S232]|uniref:ABC transporter ATP-binding protein n=1 Tax=Leisingera sp. S232 TaxID=3415132 RepID=UPI003C7D7448
MTFGNLIDAFRPANAPPPQRLGAFLLWCLSGTWPALMFASVFSVLAGMMEVGTAYIMGLLLDTVSNAASPVFFSAENAGVIALALLFFLAVRPALLGMLAVSNAVVLQPNLSPLIMTRLHQWSLGQSVSFFDDDFAGRIAQKQMQTASAVSSVVTEIINVVAFSFASMLGALVLLGGIDWRISALFLVWLAGYIALIRWFLPRIRARAGSRAGARAMVSGQIVDTLTNIKTVKLFAHAEIEDHAAKQALVLFRNKSLHFGNLSASFRFFLMCLAGVLPVLMLGQTLFLWQSGAATQGDIVAVGVVSARIAQMTGRLSNSLMSIYSSIGEAENGMKTLTHSQRIEDAPGAQPLTVPAGRIEFDNVGFAYGNEKGGIKDISLTIQPGEKLGIVGSSGAGKSTLVALLLRLYEQESGAIRIDGQNTSQVTQSSLREKIAMVTQETAMFNRSARENIMYGRPSASEDEMITAAKKAEAHEFILSLQDGQGRTGYDAHLGERGVKLSGGQRQRIALARAILKDAPILVLDEATSALDSELEASIQSALQRAMDGKTVLAIAHRLSTINEMDRILVIEKGQVIEEGNHEVLIGNGGRYSQFWAHQAGGFVVNG